MPKANKKNRQNKVIYFDYASSALWASANPSAIHALGVGEKRKLEDARRRVARVLGAHNDEIIFTSGATESNNLAILGTGSGHMVTTNIEHASVLETAKHTGNATLVSVESNGVVDPEKITKALRPSTALVSVMYANNEIGTILPIREIAKAIRHYNKAHNTKILFHTDAVQAANYLSLKVAELGVDMMSLNASKIYGPKGIGVLYVKRGTSIRPIMFGGEQEGGMRPGTENVAGAEAMARALEQSEEIKSREAIRLTALRNYFIKKLHKLNVVINGDLENRLPNNVNITVRGIPSDLLIIELSARNIMASSKSACKSGDGKGSHVLLALNKKISDTDGSIRFSLGRDTTRQDIDYTVLSFKRILNKLKKWYN